MGRRGRPRVPIHADEVQSPRLKTETHERSLVCGTSRIGACGMVLGPTPRRPLGVEPLSCAPTRGTRWPEQGGPGTAPHVGETRRALLAGIAGCDPERLVFLDESVRRNEVRRRGHHRRAVPGVLAGCPATRAVLGGPRDRLPRSTSRARGRRTPPGREDPGDLPAPYSPELNPAEQAWSTLETAVRTCAQWSLREPYAAMKAALLMIPAADARGRFGRSAYLPASQP